MRCEEKRTKIGIQVRLWFQVQHARENHMHVELKQIRSTLVCNVPLLLQSFRHIPSRSAVLRHYIIIATQRYMRAPLLSQRNHSDLLLPAFGPFYPFYHMFLASFPFVSMFAYLPSWSSVLYHMEHSRYSYIRPLYACMLPQSDYQVFFPASSVLVRVRHSLRSEIEHDAWRGRNL